MQSPMELTEGDFEEERKGEGEGGDDDSSDDGSLSIR